MIATINPATEQELQCYPPQVRVEIEDAINLSHKAQTVWAGKSINARAEVIRHLGQLLERRKEKLAPLISIEMGKPIMQARSEIEKCRDLCSFYADQASSFLKDEFILTQAKRSAVSFTPLGVILGIMPWNFPFWQVFRFAIPTLLAGNATLLKHAPNVSGCSLDIQTLFLEAGFPKGVFQSLIIEVEQVEPIISHPCIKGITLTGSSRAGKAVAKLAGQHLKPSVLELGGSDPFIVLADADLELATTKAVESRCLNAGQSCISAKRFIIHKNIYDIFKERFIAKLKNKKIGDPADEETEIGPLARKDLRDNLRNQVEQSLTKGATLAYESESLPEKGYFYPIQVLEHIPQETPAFDEELFGPVASLFKAEDTAHAIQLANATRFGLGATIFTKDEEKGWEIAKNKLQAGSCFINDSVKSDASLPFGGIKNSGYGRELGRFGVQAFVNIKTVYLG